MLSNIFRYIPCHLKIKNNHFITETFMCLQDQSGEMPCSFCVEQTQMRLRYVSASVVITFYVCTNRITLSRRDTRTNPDVKLCVVKNATLTPNKQYWLFSFFSTYHPAIGQTCKNPITIIFICFTLLS